MLCNIKPNNGNSKKILEGGGKEKDSNFKYKKNIREIQLLLLLLLFFF